MTDDCSRHPIKLHYRDTDRQDSDPVRCSRPREHHAEKMRVRSHLWRCKEGVRGKRVQDNDLNLKQKFDVPHPRNLRQRHSHVRRFCR